jgi:hypothetical protein
MDITASGVEWDEGPRVRQMAFASADGRRVCMGRVACALLPHALSSEIRAILILIWNIDMVKPG